MERRFDSVFALTHIVGWIRRIKIQIREVDEDDKIAGKQLQLVLERARATRLLGFTGLSSEANLRARLRRYFSER